MWFGFDASGQRRCATDGSGELVSLNAAATAMSLEHDSTTGARSAESGSGLTVFSAVIAAVTVVVVLVLFVVMRRWKMKAQSQSERKAESLSEMSVTSTAPNVVAVQEDSIEADKVQETTANPVIPDLSVSEMVEVSQSTTVPETTNEAKEAMEAV